MANQSIQRAFIDGMQTVFTTLFNDGEVDGLNLYLMSNETKKNVYDETKYKVYKTPIKLVCQARLTPTQGNEDVKGIKDIATFVVPLKSLQLNNLGVTNNDLDIMRKGVIEFHGVYYTIDNILPKSYVEDVFLFYHFECTEDKYVTTLVIESDVSEGDTSLEENTPLESGE